MVLRRQRLDAELVRRQLVTSRVEAGRLIDDRQVLVNGAIADKAARQVHAGDAIVVTGDRPRFVSRGGEKLAGALETFGVSPAGLRVLDAGASTGGFTDCLLQAGAAHVVALDVGHGQLHPRLRENPKITVIERFHVRDVTPEIIGGRVDMVTADLSFISLTRVIPSMVSVCHPGATMLLLVKPQFEAGRAEVSKGRGIVTDPAVHDRVRAEVHAALEAAHCSVRGWTESSLTGADGNREFLVYATVEPTGCTT